MSLILLELNKKAAKTKFQRLRAQNKIRTCTPLQALPPQSSVSTNFTIWAFVFAIIKLFFELRKFFELFFKKN